jgi:hypothetical protein
MSLESYTSNTMTKKQQGTDLSSMNPNQLTEIQRVVDEKNYVDAWIKSCGQPEPGSSRSTTLIRQTSRLGEIIGMNENGEPIFDTNDYGDFLIQTNKRCAKIFSAYFQSLDIQSQSVERFGTWKNLTEENLVKLETGFKTLPEDELGSFYINQAKGFLRNRNKHVPFNLCEAWVLLNSFGANSTPTAVTVCNFNKKLLADFIISIEHTQVCISLLRKELNMLKSYVREFLYRKPQFHYRVWNQFHSYLKKINELGEDGEHGGHIFHSPHWSMWKELSDEFS